MKALKVSFPVFYNQKAIENFIVRFNSFSNTEFLNSFKSIGNPVIFSLSETKIALQLAEKQC